MRRPLNHELTPEDQALARRWTVAVTALYSIVGILLAVIIGATKLSTSVHVATQRERAGPSKYRTETELHSEVATLDRVRERVGEMK